jgi:3-methyladenine DNA glycosylase AlkD
MKADEVVDVLRLLGNEATKNTLIRHGAREPLFGVKVADLKPLQKKLMKDHPLALELYATGISDAMYLAGLIADDAQMTQNDLQNWVEGANWSLHSESTVPWVTAGSPHGWEMAHQWVDSETETIACAGWCTLSSLVSIAQDSALDLAALDSLLARVVQEIHEERNRVRHTMNGFIICVGGYVAPLTDAALRTADAVGCVQVDMGGTACRVPSAREYIEKMQARGVIGKKRKSAKC